MPAGHSFYLKLHCVRFRLLIVEPVVLISACPYHKKSRPQGSVFSGGSGWIRTSSGLSQQIYSLPRLSNSGARPNLSPRILVAVPHEALAKCGAGSGNRTRISSLEGLHTSLCTMPATNSKPGYYIIIEMKIKQLFTHNTEHKKS